MTTHPREIIFLRHSKLNLPFESHDAIPSGIIRDLTRNALDPTIDRWFTEETIKKRDEDVNFKSIEIIFTAQSKRCQATAYELQKYIFGTYNKKVDVFLFPYLNEVQFNIEKVYPAILQEFKNSDPNLLNTSILQAMVSGRDSESLRECYWKLDYFIEIIQKYKDRKPIVAISHETMLRVAELYVKKKHFSTVTLEDLQKTKRNTYLDGFSTDFLLSHFSPIIPSTQTP